MVVSGGGAGAISPITEGGRPWVWWNGGIAPLHSVLANPAAAGEAFAGYERIEFDGKGQRRLEGVGGTMGWYAETSNHNNTVVMQVVMRYLIRLP